ncbi:hypothetical protein CS378_11450 [Rhodococcus ruber]|nr:hypothetical protein CS378_11450 [Rhodococcus ruber]
MVEAQLDDETADVPDAPTEAGDRMVVLLTFDALGILAALFCAHGSYRRYGHPVRAVTASLAGKRSNISADQSNSDPGCTRRGADRRLDDSVPGLDTVRALPPDAHPAVLHVAGTTTRPARDAPRLRVRRCLGAKRSSP